MSNSNPWSDFEVTKNNIRFNTVARLQNIITGWSDQCRLNMSKSGKKQDLIDRMTRAMNEWKENNQVEKWIRAKAVLDQVQETGQYNHFAMPHDTTATYPPPFVSTSSHKMNGTPTYPASTGPGSSHIRYNPYAPARKIESSAPPPTTAPTRPIIRFKSSPFYRIDQAVSTVVECPESTGAMDRRSQSLNFTLTSEQITKLQAPNYQLRLFCTSSSWHTHHSTGFRTEQPCPIEFPATCEVRVNNTQLTANLKGLKKKPGTAPPPDLGSSVRLTAQISNRVEMVYVNNQQPVLHKKYYMIVYLVEVTSVDQIVEKLRKGKYKSEGDIRTTMKQTAKFDEDIETGPQKMSLKCPLSYMRVNTPCRSIHCPHAQCFDATSWFAMMEQTTTWLCPVCDKILAVEDLIIDGYFDRILTDTPESAEDVMVEADGEWHTTDNKYASAGWRASHPLVNGVAPVVPAIPKKEHTPKPTPTASQNRQEVILLSDSEEDEEGIVKRELSPTGDSYTPSLPPIPQSSLPPQSTRPAVASEVIDLTLDSGDDEPPPPKITHKRKEMELNPSAEMMPPYKRGRYSSPQPSPPLASGSSTVVTSNNAYGSYTSSVARPSAPDHLSLNGSPHTPYRIPESGSAPPRSSNANGWGSGVSLPYQAPFPPIDGPSSSTLPPASSLINSTYNNYGSRPVPRTTPNTARSPPPPPPPPSYYSVPYHHPQGRRSS